MLADKHYIGQVIVNLVINSIRYGKEGGLTRVHFRDMLDKILVEVEDNGLGISKEDLPASSNDSIVPTRGARASRAVRGSAWRS